MRTSNGVVTWASGSTNTAGVTPIPASSTASRAKIDGCTTKKRDRKVTAPRRVPAPKWLKTCRRPSSATTVCPACAPPLKRITAASGSRATMASTAKPLPSSPKLAPITAVAVRGFMMSPSACLQWDWSAETGRPSGLAGSNRDDARAFAGPTAAGRQAVDGVPDDEAGRSGPGLRDGVAIAAGHHLGGRNDDFRHSSVVSKQQRPLSDQLAPCRSDAVAVGLHVGALRNHQVEILPPARRQRDEFLGGQIPLNVFTEEALHRGLTQNHLGLLVAHGEQKTLATLADGVAIRAQSGEVKRAEVALEVVAAATTFEPEVLDLPADRDRFAFELGRLNRSTIALEIPDRDGHHMGVGNHGPRDDLLEQRPQAFSHRFDDAAHRAGDIERRDERRRVGVEFRLPAFPHAERCWVECGKNRRATVVAVRLCGRCSRVGKPIVGIIPVIAHEYPPMDRRRWKKSAAP